MEDPFSFPQTKISYLRSRDPSILSWNRHGLDKARVNLHFSSAESTVPSIPSPNEDKHVNVYLRIKGGVECSDIYAIDDATLICKLPETAGCNKTGTHTAEKYTFTKIFNSDSTQQDIFDDTVKRNIVEFINGQNSTLMAYGSSGSGKTFTLIGTPEEPGIIPRSLKYLFHSLPTSGEFPKAKPLPNGNAVILDTAQKVAERQNSLSILKDVHSSRERLAHAKAFGAMQQRLSQDPVAIVENLTPILNIWVSLAEIYNEQIFDLLQPAVKGQQRPRLKIGGLQDNIYIKDLKNVFVRSGLEAYQILQYGLHNRNHAATAVNQQSSRSHCIFTIKLVQGYDSDNIVISSFNFCDLAGSERSKKTMNVGERLKESNSINNSLLVLGRCISMVMDSQYKKENVMPPFRESKLTQLFQRALLGKEDIELMVNINPSKDMFPETQHTLNFSATAKEVVIDQVPVKILNSSRFMDSDSSEDEYDDTREEEMNDLRNQLADLVLKLSETEYELREERLIREEAIDRMKQDLMESYNEIIAFKDKQISKLKDVIEDKTEHIRQLQTLLLPRVDFNDSDIILVDHDAEVTSEPELETSRRDSP